MATVAFPCLRKRLEDLDTFKKNVNTAIWDHISTTGILPNSTHIVSPFNELDTVKIASLNQIPESHESTGASTDDKDALWLWKGCCC
jgi:hypothetical protein